jgi:hypothetical protein
LVMSRDIIPPIRFQEPYHLKQKGSDRRAATIARLNSALRDSMPLYLPVNT